MLGTRYARLLIVAAVLAMALCFTAGTARPAAALAPSCQGSDACTGATGQIGDGSCNGPSACQDSTADIGDNSCNASVGNACSRAGANGGQTEIGDNSCNDAFACASSGEGGEARIGDNSCNGDDACASIGQSGEASIGNFSCNDDLACASIGQSGEASIGDQSCNGYFACASIGQSGKASIGDQSCNGDFACTSIGQSGKASIGNFSCNGDNACHGDVSDCEENEVDPAPCHVTVTKTASPDSIPASGGTDVTYTIRIDFSDEETLNSISDDQFSINPATHCQLLDAGDTGQGPIDLTSPLLAPDGFSVLCQYTYQPPAGQPGDSYVNTVTLNVGACPEVTTTLTAAAICPPVVEPALVSPGAEPGTWDITAGASVLYEALPDEGEAHTPERSRPPNIGAGLAGLFGQNLGQPTPLPTAPTAVAPGSSTTIRPPNTGDAGLAADRRHPEYAAFAAVSLFVLSLAVSLEQRARH